MKKLQNNFTNPEQSKRLQELGLPVKSADCLSRPDGKDIVIYQPVTPCRIDEFIVYANRRFGRTYYIPVWSVGRLIEIMKVCSIPVTTWYIKSDSKQPLLEYFMDDLESALMERDIDFSKLED